MYAKSLPLLATYEKVRMYYLISSFLNGVIPFSDGFHGHETFLDIYEIHLSIYLSVYLSASFWWSFFHFSKFQITSLKASVKVGGRNIIYLQEEQVSISIEMSGDCSFCFKERELQPDKMS